jgi:hypothetical protein
MLKEVGALTATEESQLREPLPIKLRVVVHRPQTGFHHPVGKREILEVLDSIGPVALYGLHAIELVRAPAGRTGSMPAFGSYYVPGRIVLYEQPMPPWHLHGFTSRRTTRRLEKAGAVLTRLPDIGRTLVDWPEETLHRFMLEQVLLHEIGHHVLQHHKGKRPVRIARTRDHESFADRFAEKHHAALVKRKRQGE